MTKVLMYFQVHQPYRLRSDFNYFCIGTGQNIEDDAQNSKILRRVSEHCYLKTNKLILDLIYRHKGQFRVAYSLSGTVLEQLARWAPEVLTSFKHLAETGCVEFIGETYYHSLACVFSEKEWLRQVKMHSKAMNEYLGVTPTIFRNTELIYNNNVAKWAENLGFKGILAEGVDHILDWRNAHFAYRPKGCEKIKLLLRNYRLSDDIAFRFNDPAWPERPLTASKYAKWLAQAAENSDTINIFLDYETFGEHHGEKDGIFEFLSDLPSHVLAQKGLTFATPTEIVDTLSAVDTIDVPYFTSWADHERDLTAWLGNHLQKAAASSLYDLEDTIVSLKDPDLLQTWSKLQTSDHIYYMSTKQNEDGNVHRYFSPYKSPYDAFITYTNALNELRNRVDISLEKGLKQNTGKYPQLSRTTDSEKLTAVQDKTPDVILEDFQAPEMRPKSARKSVPKAV